VTALITGKRPDGCVLAPIMPWRAFAHLTKSDAYAIAAYLKSLPTGQESGTWSVWPERSGDSLRHEDRPRIRYAAGAGKRTQIVVTR
jgi:cytochrome c